MCVIIVNVVVFFDDCDLFFVFCELYCCVFVVWFCFNYDDVKFVFWYDLFIGVGKFVIVRIWCEEWGCRMWCDGFWKFVIIIIDFLN